jgi:hypothetical protein
MLRSTACAPLPPPPRERAGDVSAMALERALRTNPNNPAVASCRAARPADRLRARRVFGSWPHLYVCNIAPGGQPPAAFDVQVLGHGCFVAERRRPGQADYGCMR